MQKYLLKHLAFQKRLKHTFILVNLFAFFVSFLVFMPLAQAFKNLLYRCPLFSTITIKSAQSRPTFTTSNSSTKSSLNNYYVDSNLIKWDDSNSCELCIVSGIVCTFYTVITLCFSILFNVKHRMDKQMLPALLVVTLVQSVIMLASAFLLTNGFNLFCSSLNMRPRFKCYNLQSIKWTLAFNNESLVDYMIVSLVAAWLLVVFMLANLCLLLVRIDNFLRTTKSNFKRNKEIQLISKYALISQTRRKNIHLDETKL